MKRVDQSDDSATLERLSGELRQLGGVFGDAPVQREQEILHGKRKNKPWQLVKGRPTNTPFELCVKPYRALGCQARVAEKVFCLGEVPCWSRKEATL